jgi:hypothetical protein
MGPIRYPETSVRNQPTLRNIPEEDIIQVNSSGSPRPHREQPFFLGGGVEGEEGGSNFDNDDDDDDDNDEHVLNTEFLVFKSLEDK